MLVVLVIIAGAVSLRVSALSWDAVRLAEQTDREAELLAAIQGAAEAIAADPTPESDSPLDPVFEYQPEVQGVSVQVQDIGSRINPNWIQKAFVDRSSIRSILEVGFSPDDLQVSRLQQWYWAPEDPRFEEQFTDEARESLLTRYGYVNLNVGGELAMERLYAEVTGDDGAAAAFRTRIQDALREQRLITEEELVEVLSPYFSEVYPLYNVFPAWNIHFADEALISAVITYPAYGVDQAEAKAQTLISERNGNEMSVAQMRAIVGAGDFGRVFEFLGTTTWFWQITAQDSEEFRTAVIARIPGTDRSDDTFRIVSITGGRLE
jgi:hypothetical protein